MSWFSRILGRDGTSQAEIDSKFFAMNVRTMPLNHGILGHYRVAHRCALIATQAANSRLFEIRNAGTNIVICTRFNLQWIQTAAHTAAIEDSLDLFKCTAFSATDGVNTVNYTTPSTKRTSMAALPANIAVRGVTVAGAAAGMTGGTLTKDAQAFCSLPLWLTLAFTDPAQRNMAVKDCLDDVNGTHPFVFANNEGLILENRVLLGAAAGSSVYIDACFAEIDPTKY